MIRSTTTRALLGGGGLLLAFGWAIVRSGFVMNPVLDDMVAAANQWPDRLDSWMTEFYADSPLYIVSFRALGLESAIDLVRLAFVAGVVATLVLCAWVAHTTGDSGNWRAARLVVLGPMTAVTFASLGSYDPFTFLAWGATLWAWSTGRRAWLIAASVLLGFQHFEQAVLGVAALLLTWLALRAELPAKPRALSPAWAYVGILAGKLLLVAILLIAGQPAGGRAQWLEHYLLDWSKNAIVTGPYLLWSLFAGLWVVVITVWIQRTSRFSRTLLLGAFVVGLIATALSGDRPRVFVIVMTPALLVTIAAFMRNPGTRSREKTIAEAVAWLAPPVILAGKTVINANIVDNAYVTFMWITGLGN